MFRANALIAHVVAATPDAGSVETYRQVLHDAREALRVFIDKINCAPILIRLAWHDSGTFDKEIVSWPQCGGANGSIRFDEELAHGANAGLAKAVNYLQSFKKRFPALSWADLIQLASATAIEIISNSACRIPMRYGRQDAGTPAREGNLPASVAPFPKTDGFVCAKSHVPTDLFVGCFFWVQREERGKNVKQHE
eukprot:GEMP01101349.1.p1 GENE.GEMP01101349.1~~GEMP01101349.1.p1  ORF type:complete len:195 (+),score=33.24 GEMP01101349.1:2-586(+)